MQFTQSSDTLLQIGDLAPDMVITCAANRAEFTLSSLWKEGPAVLIFLRHLGCVFCREHVAQLQNDNKLFAQYAAKVALISLGKPEDSATFCVNRAPDSQFHCLCDFERRAHQAFGLSRIQARDLFLSPHIYARGFQAALHGHFSRIPKEDPFQMPGVFIVDSLGILRYVHRHRDAADNPPNSALFSILQTL